MKDALVIAAHPDDELLGLSRLLVNGGISDVVYVLSVEPDAEMKLRLREAEELAKRFDFDVHTVSWVGESPFEFNSIDRIFLPAPTDLHREHQMALTWGLQNFGQREGLHEYSIEKNAPYVVPLPSGDVAQKRTLFNQLYRSQLHQLTDPKYFLFEGFAPMGVPSITVRFKEPGIHFWRGAPNEVAFLAHPHRHLFGVALTLKNLSHLDREQEFFLVQDWARTVFRSILANSEVEGFSCEMMARDLGILARARYHCSVTVEVSEDDENSAQVSV